MVDGGRCVSSRASEGVLNVNQTIAEKLLHNALCRKGFVSFTAGKQRELSEMN